MPRDIDELRRADRTVAQIIGEIKAAADRIEKVLMRVSNEGQDAGALLATRDLGTIDTRTRELEGIANDRYLALTEIAGELHASRGRVRDILKRPGLAT